MTDSKPSFPTDETTEDTSLPTIVHSAEPVTDEVLIHAGRIKGAWQKAHASIIETGKLLQKAKDDLGHGKFKKLFDSGLLPFTQDVAQELMRIAKNPILSNPDHGPFLPPHWRTLAVLTRAKPKQLEQWLDDKTINVETERAEVEALISPVKKPDVKAAKTTVTTAAPKRKYTKDMHTKDVQAAAARVDQESADHKSAVVDHEPANETVLTAKQACLSFLDTLGDADLDWSDVSLEQLINNIITELNNKRVAKKAAALN